MSTTGNATPITVTLAEVNLVKQIFKTAMDVLLGTDQAYRNVVLTLHPTDRDSCPSYPDAEKRIVNVEGVFGVENEGTFCLNVILVRNDPSHAWQTRTNFGHEDTLTVTRVWPDQQDTSKQSRCFKVSWSDEKDALFVSILKPPPRNIRTAYIVGSSAHDRIETNHPRNAVCG